jgi:hypothetical protein
MQNTNELYKDCESAIQTLIRVLPLLSSMKIDADDKRVDEVREVEEDYNAGVLSQDEIIRRLKPLRLTVVAGDCDLAYCTVLRLSRGETVQRKSIIAISEYLNGLRRG